jgi:hypothetical protein
MQVADEVKQEFEGDDLLLEVCCWCRKFACEFLNLVGDAIVRSSARGWLSRRNGRVIETGRVEIRGCQLDIDEMPLPRPLAGIVDVRVAIFVCPGCSVGNVVRCERIGIRRKQRCYHFASAGIEERLRDKGDDPLDAVARRSLKGRARKSPRQLISCCAPK